MGTELKGLETPGYELRDDSLWGTWALVNAPDAVMEVHRSSVEAGCDVISTDTWGIQSAMNGDAAGGGIESGDWMQLARQGTRLARRATAEVGAGDETAGGC